MCAWLSTVVQERTRGLTRQRGLQLLKADPGPAASSSVGSVRNAESQAPGPASGLLNPNLHFESIDVLFAY